LCLDGTTVSINLVGSPIINDGQVAGIVLVLHDMTQERQYIANLLHQRGKYCRIHSQDSALL